MATRNVFGNIHFSNRIGKVLENASTNNKVYFTGGLACHVVASFVYNAKRTRSIIMRTGSPSVKVKKEDTWHIQHNMLSKA